MKRLAEVGRIFRETTWINEEKRNKNAGPPANQRPSKRPRQRQQPKGGGFSKMTQLLFMVVLVKGVVTMLLMLKIGPLRELVMKGLEQVNMGRGLATVKIIAMRMAVILLQVLQAF
ncbi:hypothetical protein Sjap_008934 [Stephania japonica]|uniref:Uncharacterized protein n=1 Tax=Stephania japonica TaxID=461633 RepID=A0AAP0PF45_9MAGN